MGVGLEFPGSEVGVGVAVESATVEVLTGSGVSEEEAGDGVWTSSGVGEGPGGVIWSEMALSIRSIPITGMLYTCGSTL